MDMDFEPWNELEIASASTVMHAARQFAQALVETEQFQAFERAYDQFRRDAQAQSSLSAYQQKQWSLKALLMLNAVSEEDRRELQRLQNEFYSQPAVVQYIRAQEELTRLCQLIGDQISDAIGIDYGSACRTGGCCG
jgi:cell fate (sporulation/competence/biofilm development) regulator YlbF (YheA/YmcA/DUF963 family)